MKVREFLALVRDEVEASGIGDGPGQLQWRQRFSFLQCYRRDPRVHFEVWPQSRTGRVEVGLHFEGPREFSYRWAEAMARRAPEIMARLGPDVELEEWTPSWARLHRSLPFSELTPSLAREVATALRDFVRVLEPVIDEEWDAVLADAPTDVSSAPREGRRRFRRRSRR